MNIRQIVFLVINIIGGILVIGSYIYGIKTHGNADAFWGSVPKNIHKYYAISMAVAAISYFAFSSYVLLRIESGYLYHFLFTVLLAASAFWMPLTYVMIENPATATWIGIRVILVIVALASLGIFIALLFISPRPTGWHYWSAVVGALLFTLHTGVLDAILWPALWR
jgi:hypothetical protein